ncbi:recombination protein NinB [Burkholderia anthina]|uniref:recombination protein NinB n=1 Tax=Burkholderia anthina TaxID=179879 RepID=UPI001AA08ADB|nr:recombination protein NinB [Burkholderia anthina]QTD88800.1 recombination protein NinB [Burkholderia anthina]
MAALATFILRGDGHAKRLYEFLKANWRQMAAAGKPVAVTVYPYREKRTIDQNKKLHAMIREIAEQAWIDGRQYSEDSWKEIIRRTYIGVEEIDLPDGTRIERGISTTTLTVEEFAQLITVVQAWATTELGIEFSE